jgi:hypothetical protein
MRDVHRPSNDRVNSELIVCFAADQMWRTIVFFILLAIGSMVVFLLGKDTLSNSPWVKYIFPGFCVIIAMALWLMGRYRYEARFDLKDRSWYVRKYFLRPQTYRSGFFDDLSMVELKRCEYSPDMGGCSNVLYQVNVHGSNNLKVTLFMSDSIREAFNEAELVSKDLGLKLLDHSREGGGA